MNLEWPQEICDHIDGDYTNQLTGREMVDLVELNKTMKQFRIIDCYKSNEISGRTQ